MPIEIRELQITTVVSNASPGNSNSSSPAPDTNSIITQCVEQVLDILKQKEER